ncbi:MAG: pyridoxamine 5'-phosphate oxidase family protein, partial [Motilibacteraceae bacterium]
MTSGTTGGPTQGHRDEKERLSRTAPALADGEGLLELPRPLCLRLLAGHDVGRLVFSAAGLPAVVPIAYLLDDESIVVRTREDSRVARHAMDTVVAFEVDELEPSVRSGWSVVVTGRTSRVGDPGELARLQPR